MSVEEGFVFEGHCHSYVSDGASSPELLVRVAVSRGVRVLSITDHDTFRGSILAWRVSRALDLGLTVVYGAEVLTDWGDVLIYCLEPLREPLPVEFGELRDLAGSNNCVLIAPHPFHPFIPSVRLRLVDGARFFDAVEVWNGKSIPVFNIPAIVYARRLGKPAVSGSDAHVPSAVGETPTIVYSSTEKPEDVLEAIRRGLTRPVIKIASMKSIVEDIAWSVYRRI
ncbi:MAG: PHP-associated domain-containing protein [Acidilobaceae archaeon]